MVPSNKPDLQLPHDCIRESIMKSRDVLSKDIIMIRGEGTYSWIYLKSGQLLLTSRTVKYWMQWFKSEGLVRVHRSYVIHRDQIDSVEVNGMHIQMCGGHKVAIARSKKKIVKKLLF